MLTSPSASAHCPASCVHCFLDSSPRRHQHGLLLSLSKPLMCRGQQPPGHRQWLHPGRTPAAAHESLEDSLRETAHCWGQWAGACWSAVSKLPSQTACADAGLPAMLCSQGRLPAASRHWAALHDVQSSVCCAAAGRCILLDAPSQGYQAQRPCQLPQGQPDAVQGVLHGACPPSLVAQRPRSKHAVLDGYPGRGRAAPGMLAAGSVAPILLPSLCRRHGEA